MIATGPGASGSQVTEARLMYESPVYFMIRLRDEAGRPLQVPAHIAEWLGSFLEHDRLVLLAPRGHGKSVSVVCYLLWLCWRHNRHPDSGELLEGVPEGAWEAVIFSAQLEQATHFFETFQRLLLANEHLFADLLPEVARGRRAAVKDVWSRTRTRLKNRAEISIRAFRTSTRGLHPDVLILDDVLSDDNTSSSYQRDKTWRYFSSTLVPMKPTQLIVVGTALHHDDLLHRLRPRLPGAQ